MEFHDLKVGLCIHADYDDDIMEGVITDIVKNDVYVTWFRNYGSSYFSESVKYGTIPYINTCISSNSWRLSPNPHFCKIENLYDILKKYIKQDNIELLAISEDDETSFIYLKNGNKLLEIVVCNGYNMPVIRIEEIEDLNDMHLTLASYLIYKNVKIFNFYETLYGVIFHDKNKYIQLTILQANPDTIIANVASTDCSKELFSDDEFFEYIKSKF